MDGKLSDRAKPRADSKSLTLKFLEHLSMTLKYFKYFAFIIVAIFVSCQLSHTVVHNFAGINDHKIFPARKIENSESVSWFHYSNAYSNKLKELKVSYEKEKNIPFEQFIIKHKTVAFLIIKNDSLVYENYFRGRDTTSWVASFSMAKSFLSALIGIAIEEGLIKSVNEPVTNYIPELKKNGFDSVTIEHLLQMTSGIDFNENYFNPFGTASAYYYGSNLKKQMRKIRVKTKPGTEFNYVSGNSQLLGWVLERALKGKTISEYLQEKIWQPLGMESDASWSVDRSKKDGIEKAFCCLNATARDFGRFGQLYLHNGNAEGKQIVPENWVKESTTADTTNGGAWYYKYQWWLESKRLNDYCAHGFLGQYIYVWPSKNLVIVRLGKTEGGVYWPWIFWQIGRDL